MTIKHPALINVKVSISDSLLVEVLLLLKILYCCSLSVQSILYLIILPHHSLLLLLKAAHLVLHGDNLAAEFVHGRLELLVPILLIGQVIFHVLVHTVNVLFLVEEVVVLRGAGHKSA